MRVILKNRRDIQSETKDEEYERLNATSRSFFLFFFSMELIIFRPFNNHPPPFAEASACGSTQSVPSYSTMHSRMLRLESLYLRAHVRTLLYIRFRELRYHICKKGRRVKPPFTESAQTTVLLVIMVIKQMSSAYRDVNNEGSALTKSFRFVSSRLVSSRFVSRVFKITLTYLYPLPAFPLCPFFSRNDNLMLSQQRLIPLFRSPPIRFLGRDEEIDIKRTLKRALRQPFYFPTDTSACYFSELCERRFAFLPAAAISCFWCRATLPANLVISFRPFSVGAKNLSARVARSVR